MNHDDKLNSPESAIGMIIIGMPMSKMAQPTFFDGDRTIHFVLLQLGHSCVKIISALLEARPHFVH